jgi:crotonobetainyl-CoA:carnitine CoA-transferase CaiB-like acyl-CoA transferase
MGRRTAASRPQAIDGAGSGRDFPPEPFYCASSNQARNLALDATIEELSMTRPFEGIRIIDATHVLAGPFAAYQLAVLGADVIKVEHPDDPDQTRDSGTDRPLNRGGMGTSYLTQGSNKRAITLDLKSEAGRAVLKRLVARADVMVENFRPGAFAALGLGYEAMSEINPRLIYCSISAFGQEGPRGNQTAYDHVIQATSGLMATTGTEDVNPIKFGSPAVDYATGTMGAFALASALFQRERTGRGQRIDLAMLDVAMILMSSHLTGYLRNGAEPKPSGNRHLHATNSCYAAKDGLVMLGASNLRQQRRLWQALDRPEMVKRDNEAREQDREREAAALTEILETRTADEWEAFFQARHVPAARVRSLAETVRDPQFATRGVTHHHASAPGVEGGFDVPLAAFKFAHGGPSIERPPPEHGADTDGVLAEHGYDADQIAALRKAGVI